MVGELLIVTGGSIMVIVVVATCVTVIVGQLGMAIHGTGDVVVSAPSADGRQQRSQYHDDGDDDSHGC